MKTMPIRTLSKTQSPEPMLEHTIRLRAFETLRPARNG